MSRNPIFLILLSLFFLFGGCEDRMRPLCGGHDPINTLPWLKAEIEELQKLPGCNSISRAYYKKNSIFIISNCEPNVNSAPQFHDCSGNILNIDPDKIVLDGEVELIWKKS